MHILHIGVIYYDRHNIYIYIYIYRRLHITINVLGTVGPPDIWARAARKGRTYIHTCIYMYMCMCVYIYIYIYIYIYRPYVVAMTRLILHWPGKGEPQQGKEQPLW